ncbi:MAG: THUMP domain-containing protein [Candidatus Zixiibacteriota bacterium]
MDIENGTFEIVAKTLSCLEDALAEELTALGAKDVKQSKRTVSFKGDKRFLYKVSLWCRLATRILVPIKTFSVKSGDELYHHVYQVRWDDYLRLKNTFAINAVINFSEFNNSMFVAQKAKDALVDWFRTKYDKRPSVDVKHPDVRINIHIRGKQATLSMDASGEPLSKRGYRTEAGKAPVNEVLAAGILTLCGWDKQMPLVDGMCGSGTFLIEAAQMARNIAPGLSRKKFGFMNWRDYDENILREIVQEAQELILPKAEAEIIGSDIDPARIKEAQANAGRARVKADIKFSCKDFATLVPPRGPGVLVINPPYGERMVVAKISQLYKLIGDALKANFENYNAYILTSSLKNIKFFGLRTSQRIKLFNGPLECKLLKYEMYKGSRKEKYQTMDDNRDND